MPCALASGTAGSIVTALHARLHRPVFDRIYSGGAWSVRIVTWTSSSSAALSGVARLLAAQPLYVVPGKSGYRGFVHGLDVRLQVA